MRPLVATYSFDAFASVCNANNCSYFGVSVGAGVGVGRVHVPPARVTGKYAPPVLVVDGMARRPLDEAGLTRVLTLIEERHAPIAVLIYGSRSSGVETEASDVDLGILFGALPPSQLVLVETKGDLEEILGRDVDLVALDSASPILRMEILRNHRLLRNRDPEAFEAFVVKTLAEYFDLKRIREPIERALFAAEKR